MIAIVLLAACWILVLSLVIGLCLAARRGDIEQGAGAEPVADGAALEQRQALEQTVLPAAPARTTSPRPRRSEPNSLAGVGGATG